MVQRPDDTRTETVQLLHGLWPQAERQVRVQTVVPAKPTTNPTHTEGSECQSRAEESYEEISVERKLNICLIRAPLVNSECFQGAVLLYIKPHDSLKDFTCIRQVSSIHLSVSRYHSPLTACRQFAQRGQMVFQLQDAQRPTDSCGFSRPPFS